MNVLIVDDEMPIRQWFAYVIANTTEHTVAGVACNGVEALEMIAQKPVDVVITDIAMPKMDGLQLAAEINLLNQGIEIIILTCHEEFQYAKEAVNLGVFVYLLKTEVDDDKIKQLLTEVEKHHAQRQGQPALQQTALQGRRNEFFRGLLCGKPTGSLQEQLRAVEINIKPNANWFLLSVTMRDLRDSFEIERSQRNCDIKTAVLFKTGAQEYFILCDMGAVASLMYLNSTIHRFASRLTSEYDCRIGVSHVFDKPEALTIAISEAVRARSNLFYTAGRHSFSYNSTLSDIAGNTPDHIFVDCVKKLDEASGSHDRELTAEFLTQLRAIRHPDIALVKKLCVKWLDNIYRQNGKRMGTPSETEIAIAEAEDFDRMEALVLGAADSGLSTMNTKYSDAVNQAIAYIHSNYHTPLSLDELADQVHLNPQYFSRIFKEETGENFSVYLMMLRLAKAEAMLKNTNKKVGEVAIAVGYNNLSYFSRIYKKYLGRIPRES